MLPYLENCPLNELSGANFIAVIDKHCNIQDWSRPLRELQLKSWR